MGKWPKKVGKWPKVATKVGREIWAKFIKNRGKWADFGQNWAILAGFVMDTDEICGEKMVCGQKPTFFYNYYKEKIKIYINLKKFLAIWPRDLKLNIYKEIQTCLMIFMLKMLSMMF